VATLHPQHNYLTNLPVKAFEYMTCSLPVVMSDFPYWREVFEGAALFVDPQRPEAIAAAIRHLLDHPDEARRLGERGRMMVEEKYSWEAESVKLLALYDHILSKSA
jgi:glycosyltransferase involved in cell wall biosynthesis